MMTGRDGHKDARLSSLITAASVVIASYRKPLLTSDEEGVAEKCGLRHSCL